MSDEDKMAINTQEVSTAEVTPSSENDTPESNQETQEATPSETTQDNESGEVEVEHKRSRLEKRLEQLLSQSKEARKSLIAENSETLSSKSQQQAADAVLRDPNQLADIVNEYGEVDVVKLLDKVNQMADERVAKALGQRDQQTQYHRQVNEWYEDAESTLRAIHTDFGDDPDLVESLNQRMGKLVEKLNLDNGQFKPKVKSSELYNDLKETIVRARTYGQSKASANLAEIADTGALKPKVGNNSQSNDIDSLKKRMATDPASVRKELEKRLPRAQDY